MKKLIAYFFLVIAITFTSCEQQRFDPGYLVFDVLTKPSIAIERVDKDGKTSVLIEKMTITYEKDNANDNVAGYYVFQNGDNVYKTKLRSFEDNNSRHICTCIREDGKYFRIEYISDNPKITGDVLGRVYFYVTEPVATEKELKNAVKYKYHTI